MAKILGTNKFVIYMYNARNIRQTELAMPEHFVGKQWGRIYKVNEDGKPIGDGYAFSDYGQMITFINKILVKSLRKNLRSQGTWRKKDEKRIP